MPSLNVATTNDLGLFHFYYYVATFKIIITIEFCNHLRTRSVKCRDTARNVATLFLMLISIYVVPMKNLCHGRKCPFQFESKIDYVATQRNYVATLNFNFKITSLSVFTQETFKTRSIHSYPSEHTCEDSFNHQRHSIQV